jgi:hypothetical protein
MPTDDMKNRAKTLLAGVPGLYRTASAAYRSLDVVQGMLDVAKRADDIMMGARPIVVSYGGVPRPRWGHGTPPHAGLAAVLERGRARYADVIRACAPFRAAMEAIPLASADPSEPSWENGYFSGLDAAALYGLLAARRPRRYLEIGSGNSTRLARRAIRDQGLETTITSIDPYPRAEIDALCDTAIRQPLEDADLGAFERLERGDVLFFDGSHHAFMNSDVVVLFLDILPRLAPGVLVHIHDIFLPYDYPPDWAMRYYTEQYLLAVALLAPAHAFEVLLPAQFVARDAALSKLVEQELGPRAMTSAQSFWLETRAP